MYSAVTLRVFIGTFIFFLIASTTVAVAGITPQLGLRRGSQFHLDYNRDGVTDVIVPYGGGPSDKGLVGDFNGDTISDLAIYRNGFWFISLYSNGVTNWTVAFGTPEDVPLSADINGDGLADIVLYRPSTGVWYVKYNRGGAFPQIPDRISFFGGGTGDVPVLGDFNGNGTVDRAIYRNGSWRLDLDWNGVADKTCTFGGAAGDIPLAADFDGNWVDDLVFFRNGTWYIDTDCNGTANLIRTYGGTEDRPLTGVFNTANSVFVNSAAGTGGNGSQRFPVKTVAAALALASPGTSIRLTAGTYPAPVAFSRYSNLTLIGAGWNATHLTGGGAAGQDALQAIWSSGITLRNLHVKSPNQRGVINKGSSLTLDRVSTIGNYGHGVLATSYSGVLATLSVLYSRLDETKIGTGIRLGGGVSATVLSSSVSRNGTAVTDPAPSLDGRGIEALSDTQLVVRSSTIADNHDGGILVDNTQSPTPGSTTVESCNIQRNGVNGIIYGNNTKGLVRYNNLSYNGAATPANGIELLQGWNGPSMTIVGNTFAYNTNGVIIGSGTVTVANNYFNTNRVGVWVARATTVPSNVTIRGNILDAQAPIQVGVFILELWGNPIVTIGGPAAAEKNVFKNQLARPAIACNSGTAITNCRLSWNQFLNSTFPVSKCACPP